MYLEHIKSKLGSTNAKVPTGKSESVTRLKRKKGGCIKRTKHAMGGMGGMDGITPFHSVMTPAPSAGKFGGHKKGKRVKREPHFIGAMLGAASAIPAIIDLVNRFKKK
jgi:hypothetical protein